MTTRPNFVMVPNAPDPTWVAKRIGAWLAKMVALILGWAAMTAVMSFILYYTWNYGIVAAIPSLHPVSYWQEVLVYFFVTSFLYIKKAGEANE